jgi:phospholipid/cholesterol/gamma-HCH transport system ATP-binding protein
MSSGSEAVTGRPGIVLVEDLTIGFGDFELQRGLRFVVGRGDIFIIMGGSGCGKSTLLRNMVGLHRPLAGEIRFNGRSIWSVAPQEQTQILKGLGVMFQQGALWSSMTLAENVALPLGEAHRLSARELRDIAALKLALVGLAGFEDYFPAEISGGMRKRAAIARAMALDPDILFLDEPSAGLDPITSRRLDDLVLELRDALGVTFVIVTHELASIFAIGDNGVFLDAASRTMIAQDSPRRLLEPGSDPRVRAFLTRGQDGQPNEVPR